MKPLFHPSLDEITVEGILHAFSDPVRIQIYANLEKADCASRNCLDNNPCHLPKSTLSQHFRVLREAGLIRSERRGVELINTTRCAEIRQRFGDLVGAILRAYQEQQTLKTSS